MNDSELLKNAAKAAGLNVVDADDAGLRISSDGCCTGYRWNPLTDDGDALRLAVKLHIDFKAFDTTVRTWVGDPVAQRVIASIEELCGADPYAATRRAITRAAAEIGKAMQAP